MRRRNKSIRKSFARYIFISHISVVNRVVGVSTGPYASNFVGFKFRMTFEVFAPINEPLIEISRFEMNAFCFDFTPAVGALHPAKLLRRKFSEHLSTEFLVIVLLLTLCKVKTFNKGAQRKERLCLVKALDRTALDRSSKLLIKLLICPAMDNAALHFSIVEMFAVMTAAESARCAIVFTAGFPVVHDVLFYRDIHIGSGKPDARLLDKDFFPSHVCPRRFEFSAYDLLSAKRNNDIRVLGEQSGSGEIVQPAFVQISETNQAVLGE